MAVVEIMRHLVRETEAAFASTANLRSEAENTSRVAARM